MISTYSYDCLILGSGIAGLSAAHAMAGSQKVAILTKYAVKEGATQYAQGGIAVAFDAQDRPSYHLQDTLAAGDGLCDEAAVKVLVEEGPQRVSELIQMGAQFDRRGEQFDLTQEAAHTQRRILHARDQTGKVIEETLVKTVSLHPNIQICPFVDSVDLIVVDNQIQGCWGIQNGKLVQFRATKVILATGGCGQLYERNSNPAGATGDGMAMAYRAGAVLQDLEFIQFHPTTLYQGDKKPISLFLISEAVRGEGGILRNIHGEAFMKRYHERAELATRDEVARAIVAECQVTQAGHVYLDLSGLNCQLPQRFPTIYKRCLEAGVDITKAWIPVSPAAHYMMGGVQTDTDGRTSINGLFAVGEVASTGIHGANRLASNSLLEGLVFGYRAGKFVQQAPEVKPTAFEQVPAWGEASPTDISKASELKTQIRKWMWDHVGILRNQDGLRAAIRCLNDSAWIDDLLPSMPIREVQNMRLLARLIAEMALKRTESRGAHFRTDFPQTDDLQWKRHLKIQTEKFN
jgi:L-aspartate oxidase